MTRESWIMMKGLMSAALLLGLGASAQAATYYNCNVSSGCAAQGSTWTLSTYTKTRYPQVLVHGMFGFNSLGPMNYFYGIPQELADGGANSYVVKVDALNSTEVRGEQLLKQVKTILALTGSSKVNLIGHSQGGPTSRYVLGVSPASVASVTSVGSPHKGSPVADIVKQVNAAGGVGVSAFMSGIANGLAGLINLISGNTADSNQNFNASIESLSTTGSAKFNARFPAGMPTTACGEGTYTAANGARLYSWGGTSPLTNVLDPSDAFTGALSLAFSEDNDGLVGRCSNHFGQVLRDNYSMNHLDEVNMMFGLGNLFETNPKSVFRAHANRMKNAGL